MSPMWFTPYIRIVMNLHILSSLQQTTYRQDSKPKLQVYSADLIEQGSLRYTECEQEGQHSMTLTLKIEAYTQPT